MADWRKIKKIDAHIHIIPDVVHKANPDSEDEWVYADQTKYLKLMEKYNIEQAVIMPLNDPYLMSMEFTVDAVNKNLKELVDKYPDKFFAMADIDVSNYIEVSKTSLIKAIEEYKLNGLKIHPNNTGMNADDEYNVALLEEFNKYGLPVFIHSYPNSKDDRSATYRIKYLINKFPNIKFIISHIGAYQYEELLDTNCYVDISAILPDYVNKLGIKETNEILRKFGAERLIFATDYPSSRCLAPEEIYDRYFDILNQMDFEDKEIKMIAYDNIKNILENVKIKEHYDLLIDENNDSFHDCEELQQYMNTWDGQKFIEELKLTKNDNVLEIGIGTGRIAVKVAPYCLCLTGIDFSYKTIERAKENLSKYKNITYICDDFITRGFNNTFDKIYSSLTFMHFYNKKQAIHKIDSLLNEGGIFVLSIDKNKSNCIDMGTRKIKIYPDNLNNITEIIKTTSMNIEKVIELENAFVIVCYK